MQSASTPTCISFAGAHQAMTGLQGLATELGLHRPRAPCRWCPQRRRACGARPRPAHLVDQRYGEQGEMLAKLLLDHIADPQAPIAGVSSLASTFIIRESLGLHPPRRELRLCRPFLYVPSHPL